MRDGGLLWRSCGKGNREKSMMGLVLMMALVFKAFYSQPGPVLQPFGPLSPF